MRKLRWTIRCIAAWLLALTVFFGTMLGSYALYAGINWPQATGEQMESKGGLTLDISNAALGYVMVRGDGGNKRLKLRVSKGESTLTYDLNANGNFEAIPLQLGSDNYDFELFRNVQGNKYAQDGSVSIQVRLDSEYAAYLLPNQYVNYSENSEAVRISDEICAGLESDKQKVRAVRDYVVNNFTYNFDKAATVTAGTMPSIDELLATGKGICQDIAAFTACMLRVQGIPTQMVIGYANQYYHAWNNVFIDGEFQRIDLTAEISSVYNGMTYTPERYY